MGSLMSNILRTISAVLLAMHGLIHLIGPAVYWKVVELEEFAYKTTLLDGRWDLGDAGIKIFSV
jgi:hypothetical protein